MDATTLFVGLILSSIGMGYIVYGRKQKKPIPLVCGLVLCGIPFVISSIPLLVIMGIALTSLPFLVKL